MYSMAENVFFVLISFISSSLIKTTLVKDTSKIVSF